MEYLSVPFPIADGGVHVGVGHVDVGGAYELGAELRSYHPGCRCSLSVDFYPSRPRECR